MTVALCLVCVASQVLQQLHELAGLADEKAIAGQRIHSPHRHTFSLGRTNDRAWWKLAAEKHCRLGHDQVRLEILPTKGRRIQIGESDRDTGDRIDHVCRRNHVARFVLPGLEVADLGSTDAEEDPKHFSICGSLRQGWIEATASLFDPGKVESCGIGNGPRSVSSGL